MEDQQRTDAMLMEILVNRQTITSFLDAVFGFLRRNTDFYHLKRDNFDNLGFDKGVRERILYGALQRYDPDCRINKLATEANDDDEENYAPPAVEEIEVQTEETLTVKPPPPPRSLSLIETNAYEKEPSQQPQFSDDDFFMPADYKNGAVNRNFCWSQTLKDIELHVRLPPTLTSAKQLQIEIKSQGIAVRSRLEPNEVIVAGQLSDKCRNNDAVWTLVEKRRLLINFDKAKEVWWDRLFVDDDPIDLTKIDCERYIDELPEEAQAVINKLRVQQIQQDLKESQHRGEGYEHETEMLNRLRTAWDAENSPFKGQPFDPSVVKFS